MNEKLKISDVGVVLPLEMFVKIYRSVLCDFKIFVDSIISQEQKQQIQLLIPDKKLYSIKLKNEGGKLDQNQIGKNYFIISPRFSLSKIDSKINESYVRGYRGGYGGYGGYRGGYGGYGGGYGGLAPLYGFTLGALGGVALAGALSSAGYNDYPYYPYYGYSGYYDPYYGYY